METKKYYIKKELILELEILQNPDENPDVPIEPMECRIEWKSVGTGFLSKLLNERIKINPNDLICLEDSEQRAHKVESVRVWADGPRTHLYGHSQWGMSDHLLLEHVHVTSVPEHRSDLNLDSDNVVPMDIKQNRRIDHVQLPHELERHLGGDWQDKLDASLFSTFNDEDPMNDRPYRNETDLTDFMETDEQEELKQQQWGILRVIDGGKNK